ncbi:bifunctional folylpolyglutamate synthase/ dihydrofolate synthase [uncultured Desulfovibrio sp.]|uniref:bifunctional folylpolyglutamate synthase/dihydrofolate synthase n=1 Tax=uncultured Desulfovibrio sp. TaxID=167968 RepID=UPI00262824FA|nr:bifunctional folylpolyglutamate synthase/ dihydrofolate synthase [uncultured Desulfovibrio sp.]
MSDFFRSPADILRHLDELGLFHVDMGLARMRRALAALGLTRPPFVTAQVLGTNGKGSTAAFLAALAQAHGCRTGLYTSPHFVSPAERIRIGGAGASACIPWPAERWVEAANAVMAAAPDLTYFEFLTVLALLVFRQEHVQLAVLEAGLGGRYDATSAVAADLMCYAPIAMDHRNVLGPTLAAIAADKAAAVRGPAPVCTAAQFPAAAAALAAAARAQGASLVTAAPVAADAPLGLNGPHQRGNAGLALAAWRALAPLLGKNPDDANAQALGLRRAFMPGRLQRVPGTAQHPPLLLDGAHNAHGMQALATALRAEGLRPAGAVYSCLNDKDWQPPARMLRHVLGAAPLFVVTLRNPRAARAEDIAAVCNSRPPATATALPEGDDALARALAATRGLPGVGPERPVLLTGSLYLLAEFFERYPQYLSPDGGGQDGEA